MSMQNLMMAGNTLMQMRTMQSASTKLQGRANVLKSELETDQNPSETKKAEVEELESRAQDIMGQMMEKAQKTNEELKKNETDKVQKEETNKTNAEQKQTDKTNVKQKETDSKKAVTDRVEVSGKNQESESFAAGLLDFDSGYSYTNNGVPLSVPSSPLKVDITA